MKRRDLLAALATTPTAGWAQARPAKIGLLAAIAPPPGAVEAFRDGMRQRGYVEGRDVSIDVRSPQGSLLLDPGVVTDLIRSGVDVIVAWPTSAALAAQRATSSVPIVMVGVGYPVGSGLVASLEKPGGNVTGLSTLGRDVNARQTELLVEMVRSGKRVGVIFNPWSPLAPLQLSAVEETLRRLRLTPQKEQADSKSGFETALSKLGQSGVGGVVFLPDPSVIEHRKLIAEVSLARRLPTMFQRRENVEAGGLMSYGSNLIAQFRLVTFYVEQILQGAKPAELPVEQSGLYELAINVRTANALGMTIPPSIKADELID